MIKTSTGFVEFHEKQAKKSIPINNLYWVREVALLQYINNFKHPNIIELVKTSHNTTHYEITSRQYTTLLSKAKINRDSTFIQYALDILSAVKFCHALKIWHRDITPQNILIYENRARLIDFSHAIRIQTNNLRLDDQVSTYGYRSPEVFKYQEGTAYYYDEKIDIWSLGIVFIEMLIKQPLLPLLSIYININELNKFYLHEKYYMSCIKEIYNKNINKTIRYKNDYWSIISDMLKLEPDQRLKAHELIERFKALAELNDITYVISEVSADKINQTIDGWPKLNELERPITEDITLTEYSKRQTTLLNRSYKLLDTYKKICNFHFDSQFVKIIIHDLVELNHITQININEMLFFVGLVADVVIYDAVYDIKKLVARIKNNNIFIDEKNINYSLVIYIREYIGVIFNNHSYRFQIA